MSDAMPKTTAETDIVIDIRGPVSGQVAAGKNIYQSQTNVSDGGIVYVLPKDVVPFTKVQRPVRLISRADPPLLDRRKETAAALEAIRPGGTVQITGGPGSGKSLFLTHLAHEKQATLEDGVVHLRARGQRLDDMGFRLFYAFHDSLLPTAYIPPPPQIQRELAGITAVILIDDVDDLGADLDGMLDMAIDSGFVLSSRTEVVDVGADVTLGGLRTAEAVDLFARMHRGPIPDGPGVAALCAVLDGHPQCVVFAAKLVNAEGVDPAELAAQLAGPDPCHQVAKRLLEALPESKARVAAFLAALEGAPVPIAQATAATQVPESGEILRELAGAGIAPSNSPRYGFSPLLQDAAEELWDLDELRDIAVDQLTDWLGKRSPDDPKVVETAPMVLQLMDWTAGTGRHDETVALGEGIDGALALSGLWGSWERMHKIVLGSAIDAGDPAAQGWALHQMGTKALCWGDRDTAESSLGQALTIRQEVGIQSAIDTTQHNLEILHPPPGGGSAGGETPPDGGGDLSAASWTAAFVIGAVLAIILVAISLPALTFDPPTLSFRDIPIGEVDPQTTTLWNESRRTISGVVLEFKESDQFSFDSALPVQPDGDSLGVGIVAAGLFQPSAGTTSCDIEEDTLSVTLLPGWGCEITVLLTRTSPEKPEARLVAARKGENDEWSAELTVGLGPNGTTTTTSKPTTTTSKPTTTTSKPTTATSKPVERGRIIVKKVTDSAGAPQRFMFTADYGAFELGDGEQHDSGPIPAGTHSVSEEAVGGWETAANCSDGSTPDAIDLQDGEIVTCTFTNTFTQPPSADLAITYQVSRDKVAAGQTLTYEITVHNHGPTPAGNTTVSVALPSDVTPVIPSQGCTFLRCDLGTLNSGSTVTVRLKAQISTGAVEGLVLTSTASADSDLSDPNQANNTASARTRVQAAIGLIDIDHETIEFGDAAGTEQRVRLTNVGVIDVTISGHSDPDPFEAVGCVGTTLAPAKNFAPAKWCEITVMFPASGGAWSEVLEVSHDGKGDRRVLIKSGT